MAWEKIEDQIAQRKEVQCIPRDAEPETAAAPSAGIGCGRCPQPVAALSRYVHSGVAAGIASGDEALGLQGSNKHGA